MDRNKPRASRRSPGRRLPAAVVAVALLGTMTVGAVAAQEEPTETPTEEVNVAVVKGVWGPAPFAIGLEPAMVALARPAFVAAAPPFAQVLPVGGPSIVVTGYGAASAPAETARIQFLVGAAFDMGVGMMVPAPPSAVGVAVAAEPRAEATPGVEHVEVAPPSAPTPPPQLTEADLEPVVEAIVAAGAQPDDVQVIVGPAVTGFYGPGGPGAGLIEVTVERPTLEGVTAIVDAGSQAAAGTFFLQQLGVAYDVADCGPLLRQARQDAVADGRTKAEQLAEALGVTLGDVLQVADYSAFGPTPDGGGCMPPPELTYGPGAVFDTPPFDPTAPAEARVFIQLNMVFTFDSGGA